MNVFSKKQVIGVDITPAVTSMAIVDVRGNIIAQDSIPTDEYTDINRYVEALSEHIVALAMANGGIESIRSVGVSAPSANSLTGSLEHAVNLPWKEVVPLQVMLCDRIGLAVIVANDAYASAMGEYVYGAAHGMQNFIVISLGHGGVGSSFFTNGHPYVGYHGFAGEIGHVCAVPNGRRCNCGRCGCLEQYVSERGVVLTAQELLAESQQSSLLRTYDTLSFKDIVQCCEKNDELAKEVFNRTGKMLGFGLANYATIINPEAIILTGDEQTKALQWVAPSLDASFEEHIFHNSRKKVKILVSTLNNHEREILGASALAWTIKEYSLFL